MSRILFWIILFGAGYWYWQRAKLAAGQRAARRAADGTRRGAAAAPLIEPMVRCATCGAYTPRSDAVVAHRLSFCNAEHARQYVRDIQQTPPRDGHE